MIKVDLARWHVERLDFRTTHGIDEATLSEIQELQPQTARGKRILGFGESYMRNKLNHHCMAELRRAREPESGFDLVFHYSSVSLNVSSSFQSIPNVSQLIEKLSRIKQRIIFDCLAIFRYGQEYIEKSAISLPIRVLFEAALPFDEIRGIKLVKTSDGSLEQAVIIDLDEQGSLFHSITFKYSGNYSLDMPRKILQRSTSISSQFFHKGSRT